MATAAPTNAKLGEAIAEKLERWILRERLPYGAALGTEDELIRRFEVSRWAIREAVALAELDGMIEPRRGKNGGLFVGLSGTPLRVSALRHFFMLGGARGQQIGRARTVLEGHAVRLAMSRISLDDAVQLRNIGTREVADGVDPMADRTNAFFSLVLELAGDPFLSLFCRALAQANIDRALWNGAPLAAIGELSARTWEVRREQVEALIAADFPGAMVCQRQIEGLGIDLHRTWDIPPPTVAVAIERASLLGNAYVGYGVGRNAKKPEGVARFIAESVRAAQTRPVGRIASESGVLYSLGVSRNVFRESLRLLERYGIVQVRRGNSGGVHSMRPDPAYVVRSTAEFLGEQPASWRSDGAAMLRDLVLCAVDAAMARSDANREGDTSSGPPGQGLGELVNWLSERACNPVLDAAMQSLVCLLAPPEPAADEAVDYSRGVGAAMDAGDNPLARRNAVALLRQQLGEVW